MRKETWFDKLTTITSMPLHLLWKEIFWVRVEMTTRAFMSEGFKYEPYCTETFGEKMWYRDGMIFYFRDPIHATMFTLRWL